MGKICSQYDSRVVNFDRKVLYKIDHRSRCSDKKILSFATSICKLCLYENAYMIL